jgi:hypothetical protein
MIGANKMKVTKTTTIITKGIEVQNDLSDFVNPKSINLSAKWDYLTIDGSCYSSVFFT